MSHEEILQSLGMPQEKVNQAIKNNPRRYFIDNTLVLYQGGKGRGELEITEAVGRTMEKFYSKSEQEKYGVVGIAVKGI